MSGELLRIGWTLVRRNEPDIVELLLRAAKGEFTALLKAADSAAAASSEAATIEETEVWTKAAHALEDASVEALRRLNDRSSQTGAGPTPTEMRSKLAPTYSEVRVVVQPGEDLPDIVHSALVVLRRQGFTEAAHQLARDVRRLLGTKPKRIQVLRLIESYVYVDYGPAIQQPRKRNG